MLNHDILLQSYKNHARQSYNYSRAQEAWAAPRRRAAQSDSTRERLMAVDSLSESLVSSDSLNEAAYA